MGTCHASGLWTYYFAKCSPKSRCFVPILLFRVTQLDSKACAVTTTPQPRVGLGNGAGLRMKGEWLIKGWGMVGRKARADFSIQIAT